MAESPSSAHSRAPRARWGAVWELEGLLDPEKSKCNVIAGNFGLGIYISGSLADIAGQALLWQPG